MWKQIAKRQFRWAIPLLVGIGLLVMVNAAGGDDVYTVIQTYLPDMSNIFKEINRRYVDPVDPQKLFRNAIEGMLSTLDPYTNYMEKEEKKQLDIMTEGKYQGVGLPISLRNNVVTVSDPPFLGTPAARAGIREGDQIIQVDGVDTKELGLDGTVERIRGPAGTEVKLLIRREGVEKPLEFTLVREKITIEDVRYAGFIEPGIGYIQLTRFSRNAGAEVEKAIQGFKAKGELKGLILDLRSNPGGMLEAAVEVSDLFLPKRALIVSTRGRDPSANQAFYSYRDPIYGEGPLVVLVNGISASASEIVAGAIQDHDRGIIVGDTTFGKGLVQTVVPLSKTTALKITTAKYYTPSGRCIQKHPYTAESDTERTTRKAFRTDSGRKVDGGGGIIPDVVLPRERVSDLAWDMQRKSLYFNFSVHYANTHESPKDRFEITDEIRREFFKYIESKGYRYVHPMEGKLEEFENEARSQGLGDEVIAEAARLKQVLSKAKEAMYRASQKDIDRILKQELASKLLGTQKAVELWLAEDQGVKQALTLLKNPDRYRVVLSKR